MPVLAVAAAAAGTALSVAASKQDQSAVSSARASAAKTESGYQNQASAVFNKQLPNDTAGAANAEMAKGQQQRQNVFSQLQQLAQPSGQATNPNAPEPVQAAQARSNAQTSSVAQNISNAASKQGSYGDWTTALGVQNTGVNSNLGVINNEARGRANLLPLQITAASHKGDFLRGWGSIVSSLGSLGTGASEGI